MKYYTDDELIEMVRNMGDSKESYEWVADKIGQRFGQKDNRIDHLQNLVKVAAEHIGRNMIYELQEQDC